MKLIPNMALQLRKRLRVSASAIQNDTPANTASTARCSWSAVVICNFTPVVRHDYRVGAPGAGCYRERLNTDSEYYGGSNVGNPFGMVDAEQIPAHGREWSIALTLPPLAAIFLDWEH